jgi:hypothetical protein
MMNRARAIVVVIGIAAGLGSSSCVGTAEVAVESPRLVWIADGIWVVEDYPQAVYYYDGFYWRMTDGLWYRSDWYADGFVRVGVGPTPIVRIHRPRSYIRYRPPRGHRVRPAPRPSQRPAVRDRRRRR